MLCAVLSWGTFFASVQVFCHWSLFTLAPMAALAVAGIWLAHTAGREAMARTVRVLAFLSGLLGVSALLGAWGSLGLPTLVITRMSANESRAIELLRQATAGGVLRPAAVPAEARGYRFTAVTGEGPAFALRAVPRNPAGGGCWTQATGRRGFCADDTGWICGSTGEAAPPVVAGRCSRECREIQPARVEVPRP